MRNILVVVALLHAAIAHSETVKHAFFPDVSANELVFVYRDNLWLAPVAGGRARLLADIGERVRDPKFSPDGSQIAFTATVAGNQDIFTVSRAGGPVVRVTNHPARDFLLDWYADGKNILFKSTMQSPRAVYNQAFKVAATGGLPERLPLPYAESAALSDDGSRVVFSFLKDFQEEVWKRYLGGRAPDLWSFDIETLESVRLTDYPGPDSEPMLFGDDIYFLSERGAGQRSNLWLLANNNQEPRQLTFFDEDDVRHPSIGDAGIVFQLGGELYLKSFSSSSPERIDLRIEIARDERRPKRVSLEKRIENASIGPKGKLAFEARGDVIVYDSEKQVAINLIESSDSAERYPSMSPSGRYLAFQSDAGGEYQLIVRDLSTGKERQLSKFKDGFRYRPHWSPDERYLAFIDHKQFIWLIDIKSGAAKSIDQGAWRYHWDMPQFRISWSPDSRWLAWSRAGKNRNQSIYVYDTQSSKRHQLTSGFYSDFDPVFDDSGNYLVMFSNRNFSPTFGDIDPTFVYNDSMTVSLIPLSTAVGAPGDTDWKMPAVRDRVDIDLGDAESRLRRLPFKPGRFSALSFSGEAVTVIRTDGAQSRWELLTLGEAAPNVHWTATGVQVLDAGRGKTLVKNGEGEFTLLSVAKPDESRTIQADTFSARISPHQEFLQMFDDSWRYQRDFFYDPEMHGLDWQAVRSHYRPDAASAYTEAELTAVIREMHGELSAGHVYVSAEPPYKRSDARTVGLLGVDYGAHDGRYFIKTILKPGVRRSEYRSPLDNSSLPVEEGDFLLSVNNRALAADRAPWEAFEGLAGELVQLELASTADGKDRRTIQVKTLDSERKLRELVWVEQTRQEVDRLSNGRVGYLYVPNTGVEGQNELMQMYRAQYHKDALIIDERFNTGGALGDRFVELLNRPPLNYFSSRNANDYPLPELAHRGPKAMLINSWSYSGGDGLPFLFKEAAVGPLIGTRTWGGLIGPGMRMSLINGGFISAPPQRVYDTRGEWAEGNEGVRPNIQIRNNPGALAKGRDEQLLKAVEYLLDAIEAVSPVQVPDYASPATGEVVRY